MARGVGTRLGPYQLLAPLGAGGMGEVYKARDTRLDRDVAIKLLPTVAAANVERRSRFEREAKAVASLNHPNIVTIHAIEEADGVPFFAMEYVDGQTLARTIPLHGLSVEELLRIAVPLTDAVAAAHECGILHRDLKPANVMVSRAGRVKVLDFGLAKLKEAVPHADDGGQPTAEATGEGRILGTVAYMSPEQAEGRPLDQRSDVFSLGVLLYEMATGQRPFKGDTSVSVISAILKDTPGSVTNLRPDLPRDLGRIVRRALNKDPEHRYQSAKDLRNDLETLKEDLDSGEILRLAPAPPAPALWMPGAWWAGGLLVIVAVAVADTWLAFRFLAPAPPAPPALRFFDDFTPTRVTTEAMSERGVAVSPDGRYVAYVFTENSREGLRVRQVDTSATVDAVAPQDVTYADVAFSPEGTRLYYAAYPRGSGTATLYQVSVLGGVAHRMLENVDGGITFSPDGTRFAFLRGIVDKGASVMIANADGSAERTLATREIPNEFTGDAAWSGDGRTIAAAAYDGSRVRIVTVDVQTAAVRAVGDKTWDGVTGVAWPAKQQYLIVSATDLATSDAAQLWAVTIPDGMVRRITKDIASYGGVSLTADGLALATVRSESHQSLWLGPAAQPDRSARLASVSDTVGDGPIRWAADGQLVYAADVNGNEDIWAVRADGSPPRQLTTSPSYDTWPSIAPDGRYIVFVSNRDGRLRIWRMDADGGGQTRLTNGAADFAPVVAGDSRSVYFIRTAPDQPMFTVSIEGGQPVLFAGPASPGAVPQRSDVPTGFVPIEVSPDGALILGLYFDQQKGASRPAVVPAGAGGTVRELDIPMSVFSMRKEPIAWAPDGRAVTFLTTMGGAANVWRQPLNAGAPTPLTHFTDGADIVAHAWSRDGKSLALVRGAAERHVVIMRDNAR